MLSVIVPVYNDEAFLEQTLQAIEHQTYRDYELILVDDGSTDGTEQILQKWASKDNRIKLLRQKNGGVSNAREYGYRNSTGDYLLFLDHDDVFHPMLFEQLMKHRNDADLVYAGSTEKDSVTIADWAWANVEADPTITLQGRKAVQQLIDKEEAFRHLQGCFWGMLIPRQFLQKMEAIIYGAKERIPVVYFEDVHLTHQFFLEAKTICFLDEVYILHRLSNMSLGRLLKPTPYGYDVIEANYMRIGFLIENGFEDLLPNALPGFYLSILKAWWQAKTYEKDEALKKQKMALVEKYYKEYYERLTHLKTKGKSAKLVVASIRLFHKSPMLWKVLVGNPWFKIKCRMDIAGENVK